MKTCRSCRHSFSIHDFRLNPVLVCWPNGDKRKERAATELCDAYMREVGADEPEVGE